MPFGCLALRDGRNYDTISDVTDKYEFGQVLKEFCELCLAKDRQTDKVFVCKKFLKKDGRKVRKAAKNEIMILKLVNHPNILQLIDTFETRKEYFIIQELFENGPITEPCGTPEYLAPEVVARHRYGRPVDCWAVGVIMFILLSGNPPFYDETEEENTDLHNRIIFCRIVAGDFEFDSPYWDDISPAAKELVCRLMEVDQMLRITAQDALYHEWIAGNGASEKNLKDGVCAQFEKNFAKAKWRVWVGRYGTGLPHSGGSSTSSDWQMDSVIEQIEKQMAAVLEKIEGDMPSLLEQISDCPAEQPRARSTHASPATSRARPSQRSTATTTVTPPPLPTSPRPALPSLPRISIPPPAYPPPSPPTEASPQPMGEQEDRDGHGAPAHSSQSPRPGIGRGL
uniref:CaM kinase-like vesicle-associated, like n=1 Tax=Amphilophus citrinellus TaxID=61819 RepID=A0A3Q0S698_AMPCI